MRARKITQKEVKRLYKNVIVLKYCGAQKLLKHRNRSFWTEGYLGWNVDVYEVNNSTCIVTGYRPFGNITPDYDMVARYESLAERADGVGAGKEAFDKILKDFVEEALADRKTKQKGGIKMIKEILVNDKNKEKITDLLAEVQGRATTRLLDYEKIKKFCDSYDTEWTKIGMPKAGRDGLAIKWSPYSSDFPRAYKHTPHGTVVRMVYKRGTWRITEIERDGCDLGARNALTIESSPQDFIERIYKLTINRVQDDSCCNLPG